MRSCLWFAVLVAAAEANFTAGQGGTDNNLRSFCRDFFVCASNTQCFNKIAVCDGLKDCFDNSDEKACKCIRDRDCPRGQKCRKNRDLAQSECTQCPKGKKFNGEQCQDINECLFKHDVCDGQGSCVNLDGGYTCVHCPNGYEARMQYSREFVTANRSSDGSPEQNERRDTLRRLFLCDDEDECANENPCVLSDVFGQGERRGYCVNRVGNFSCECPPNHEPNGGHAGEYVDGAEDNVCRARDEVPLIAIAENSSIGLYDLRSSELVTTISLNEPLVDIAAYKQRVFYAFTKQIWEYRVSSESHTLIVDLDEDGNFLSEIKRLAIDWVNQRIYYLTGDAVAVANIFGEGGKIIEHRGNISTLAVDPAARYLFYSEHGFVKRAHLDGRPSGPAHIFQALEPAENDIGPREEALAIDPNLKSIYYICDRILYSFDYSGHYAIVLNTQAQYARLEPFENRLYAVYRADSSGLVSLPRIGYTIGRREGRASVVSFYKSRPRAMSVLHRAKHPAGPADGACSPDVGNICSSQKWCFPLPTKHSPNYRCPCGHVDGSAANVRHDCVPLILRRLRPIGSSPKGDSESGDNILPAEISAAAGSRFAQVPSQSSRGYRMRLISTALTFLPVFFLGRKLV